MNATVYVCPYCGTEHDEPNASCCHEQGHCEPRKLSPEVDTPELLATCHQLQDSINQLDYVDYHTRSDKEWLRAARFRLGVLRGELMLRGAL